MAVQPEHALAPCTFITHLLSISQGTPWLISSHLSFQILSPSLLGRAGLGLPTLARFCKSCFFRSCLLPPVQTHDSCVSKARSLFPFFPIMRQIFPLFSLYLRRLIHLFTANPLFTHAKIHLSIPPMAPIHLG